MENPPTKSGSNDTQIPGNENAAKENPDAASLVHEAEQENKAGKDLSERDKNFIAGVEEEEEDYDEDEDDVDNNDII